MIKNKQNKLIFILSFIILLSVSIFLNVDIAYAKVKLPEPSREFYVYDEVGIIDRDLEDYIIGVNKELYTKTGAQVVIAAIDSFQNLDINTYATALYEKWKIGSEKEDNGLLILISTSEGQIWIETGYGLEGALPAGRLKRIIENDMIPSFKNNNYNEGISLGFNSVIEYIEKDYDLVLDKEGFNSNYSEPQRGRKRTALPLIIFVLVFVFADFRFFRGNLLTNLLRIFLSGRGGPRGPGGYSGGGGSTGGGGRSGGGGAGGSW